MKLIKRNKITKPEKVYNLHIDNNHNYVANSAVVSNCHGLKGQVLTKLLNEYGKDIPYRFGVTGTMPKAETDAMAVKVAVGLIRYEKQAHELIDEGHLAKLHIDIMQLSNNFKPQYERYLKELERDGSNVPPLSYKSFKDGYFPEWSAEKQFMQTDEDRLNWIAEYINIKREEGNVFCLVDGIRFGKKLVKLIPNAEFLHGSDKMSVRKEIYEKFKDNDNLVVLATVQIASTGLDIKRIFNMMAIDAGKSFVRIIQTIGRGLRKADDKDYVHFTDICSDLKYSKKHLRDRVKFYSEAKYPHKKYLVDL